MAGRERKKRSKSAPSVRYLSAEMGRRRILSARPPGRHEAWRVSARRLTVVLVLLVLTGGVMTAAALGVRTLGRRLLWQNEAYRLQNIGVTVEGRLPAENVLEFLSLPEGVNLWALLLARRVPPTRMTAETVLNIDQMRERFLARVPSVSDIEIAVELPDSILIRVTERVPRAILEQAGGYGDFVVDRYGVVFFAPRRDVRLPVISGLTIPSVRPGDDLSADLTAALHLLEAAGNPKFNREFRIRHLRLESDYLVCELEDGARVSIEWSDTHAGEAVSGFGFEHQLIKLRSALQNSRDAGRRLKTLDLTLSDDNIPATFFD